MLRALAPRTAQLSSDLLGSTLVAPAARLLTRGRMPVLAYHDVPDEAVFAQHLDFICEHYRPISGDHVAYAISNPAGLPHRAIWITFDDAHPGVFTNALPLLKKRGLSATLFVCPGVVDTDQPYWWQVIELALAAGRTVEHDGIARSGYSVVTQLKRIPDGSRRSTVARVAAELADAGVPVSVPQATSKALHQWLDAGLDVGNHSWDHPCLDMCDAEQQRHQIVAADDWLRDLLGKEPRLFAYPNGNVAGPSRAVLDKLGYAVAALFDHRLARPRGPEVSRLRIDADAPPRRLAAIASGAHPAAYALAQRLRSSGAVLGSPD